MQMPDLNMVSEVSMLENCKCWIMSYEYVIINVFIGEEVVLWQ